MARRFIIVVTIASLLTASAITAFAGDRDPTELLYEVIRQLQEGQLDQDLYGEQLKNTIREQTNDRLQYEALAKLGPVLSTNLVESQNYPFGRLYFFQARHLRGFSSWTLGVNTVSKRVEYANFNLSGGEASKPFTGDKLRTPFSQEGACKRYPNLC